MWDLGRQRTVFSHREPGPRCVDALFSDDGATMVMTVMKGRGLAVATQQLVSVKTGATTKRMDGPALRGRLSPETREPLRLLAVNRELLAVAMDYGKTVAIWDHNKDRLMRRLTRAPHCRAGRLGPGGRRFLCYGEGKTALWSLASGKLLRAWRRPRRVIPRTLQVDAAGKTLTMTSALGALVYDGVKGTLTSSTLSADRPTHTTARLASGHLAKVTAQGVAFLNPRGDRIATLVLADSSDGVTFNAEDSDWVLFTPDGYVDASAGGRHLVRWRVGGKLYPYELAWHVRRIPRLLPRLLAGDTAFQLAALRRLAPAPTNR